MNDPKEDKKKKGGQTGRPATKTMEPPARKSSDQVPFGDDSDILEGGDPEQRTTADDEAPPKRENRPIEKDKESRGDEDSGCAC
jgi:hypothetical protein